MNANRGEQIDKLCLTMRSLLIESDQGHPTDREFQGQEVLEKESRWLVSQIKGETVAPDDITSAMIRRMRSTSGQMQAHGKNMMVLGYVDKGVELFGAGCLLEQWCNAIQRGELPW